jgi:RHS repeat-associated protein
MAEPNGFYYMKARYYDPNVGRFVSEDPAGFGGGDVNLMAYVQNNPVMKIDPSGLSSLKNFLNDTSLVFGLGAAGAVFIPGAEPLAIPFAGISFGAAGIKAILYSPNPYIDIAGETLKLRLGLPATLGSTGAPLVKPGYDLLSGGVIDIASDSANGFVQDTKAFMKSGKGK